MKKILCIVLSLVTLTAMSFTSFAEDSTLAGMILQAKEKISVPEALSKFSSHVSESDGLVNYSLTWETPEDYAGKYQNVEIVINSKGDVTRYYRNSEYKNQPSLPGLSEEELEKIATDWLITLNPSWAGELYLSEIGSDIHDSAAFVNFERKVNGIPFCNNSAAVRLDKKSGEICDFYSNWQYESKIPAPDGVISKEEAQKKYFELSPLQLVYRKFKDTDEAKLIYVPENAGIMIGAADGGEVKDEETGFSTDMANTKEALAMSASGSNSARQLTPEESAVVEEMAGTISREEVVCILSEIEHTNFKNMTPKNISYGKYEDKYYVDVTYDTYKNEKSVWNYASARLDAVTGEILRLNCYNDVDSKAEEAYKDEALAIADEFVKKYAPQQKDKIKLVTEEGNNVRFVQLVNGYKYEGNNISVSVCPYTGLINSYYKNWDDEIVFESPEGIITPEQAQKIICEKPGISLKYTVVNEYTDKRELKLVYSINDGYNNVRAKDGVIVNYSADIPTEEKTVYPTDISGHYGEMHINTLIKNGVIKSENALFRPEEYITQAEALEMVAALKGYYLPRPIVFENLFSYVNRNDIVDFEEKNPDSVINRQTAVKYIVRALGYKEVAEIGGIYKTGFADEWQISNDFMGYVAIAKGLGIVNGNGNGYFNPAESVKRADFAIMIYNYLSK
ncbi:MAG: S-layer homology domain-containing protein [Clostridia bacterium]|nr:S-layer homology domain-containing protein [Clostridia bacterium]